MPARAVADFGPHTASRTWTPSSSEEEPSSFEYNNAANCEVDQGALYAAARASFA